MDIYILLIITEWSTICCRYKFVCQSKAFIISLAAYDILFFIKSKFKIVTTKT